MNQLATPPTWSRGDVLRKLVSVPSPGDRTIERWDYLYTMGRHDLALAKLVEPHLDALAILKELQPESPPAQGLWAVWAAEPPNVPLTESRADGLCTLTGSKAFCSGADIVDYALISVPSAGGSRLAIVDVAAERSRGRLRVTDRTWFAAGMRASGTVAIELEEVPARPVGDHGAYVDRAGFWHGAIGVAACWAGGLAGLADLVRARFAPPKQAPEFALRGVAIIDSEVFAARAAIEASAARIDRGEGDRQLAELTRWVVANACDRGTATAIRLLGAGPLVFDSTIRQRLDDLQVFTAQHHGDRDLIELGRIALGSV